MFPRLLIGIIGVFLLGTVAHAAPLAYIANQDSNTVSVVKTGTNSVITSIAVGSKPYGIAVHPSGTKVYVTNHDSHTVSVIDATTNTVSATVTLPALAKPAGLAINPAGTKLYVLNQDDSSASVINTTTNAAITKINLSGKPSKIVINSAGTRAYVIYENLAQVTVLDTVADTVITDIPTAINDVPLGITVNGTGSTVYLSYLLGGMATIDTATNALSAPVDFATPFGNTSFGYNNIVVSPDNTKAYVISIITNEIFVVNTANNVATASFPLPAGNYEFNGMAITPSGSHLAVTNMTNNEVYLVDTTSGLTTGTIAVGQAPQSIGNFIGPDKAIAASLTSNPANIALPGTSVTFTAQALGGSSAYEYKFLTRSAAGAWTLARDYSTSNSFAWNTAGLSGTYYIQAYVRNVGSTATYEALKSVSYTLATAATGATLSAAPLSPRPAGTQVVFTAGGQGGLGSYQYKFLTRSAAGAWAVARDYSTTNTFTWNTTGLSGTYYIQVYVRNVGSTAAYEALTTTGYSVATAVTPATGATLTANPLSPRPAGTQVLFTAGGQGGSGSYQYKFLTRSATGSWTVARDYSTTNTFTWDTTGFSGTYYIQVYVRNVGSAAAYEALTTASYSVTTAVAPATGATLSSNLQSPQVAGTQVLFTAAGQGGSGNYQYKFLTRSAAGAWTVAQDYSTTSTFSWNTTGLSGIYYIQAYVRNVGSTAAYEALTTASYSVTTAVAPATGATLSANLQSPQLAGTQVLFTAAGQGGSGNYQYKFLTRSAAGVWTEAQDYSTTSTFSWNTTGLSGTYYIQVYVRNVGSTAVYEALKAASYSVN